ncbi:hypothetical protein VTK26DRAFT_5722 [Humicola hyalothermophila]
MQDWPTIWPLAGPTSAGARAAGHPSCFVSRTFTGNRPAVPLPHRTGCSIKKIPLPGPEPCLAPFWCGNAGRSTCDFGLGVGAGSVHEPVWARIRSDDRVRRSPGQKVNKELLSFSLAIDANPVFLFRESSGSFEVYIIEPSHRR